jgi:predicted PurR-regulated permease PerM
MMSSPSGSSTPFYVRAAYLLLFLALLFTGLYLGQSLLIPIVTAVFFAFFVLPIVKKLNEIGAPEWLASLVGVLTVIAGVMTLFSFLSWQVMSFSDDLPKMKGAWDAKLKEVFKYVESHYRISRREQSNWVEQKTDNMLDSGADHAVEIFSATGSVLANLVLIPIYMFFMLFYREKFKKFIELLDPDKHDHIVEIFRKISRISQQYVRGMVIVILILAVLNSVGFLMLGLNYAILLGFMAAVLNVIPYVGVLIGSLIPVAIALVTKDSIGYALGAFGVCVFVQFLENNFITPKIIGSSVNLNPLSSMFALLFGGMMWGLPGMILAIPLAGIFKVVCDNVEHLRPYGFLLGEEGEYRMFKLKRTRKAKSA